MIPDALKPAICPTCHGTGNWRGTYQEWLVAKPDNRTPCPTCDGSGINPDMIHENEQGFGRYVVIPLGGSNE